MSSLLVQDATSLGAVYQFFLRDMTGMVGGVLFASLQGSTFDAYAKQWRLFADCLNNVGALRCDVGHKSVTGPRMTPALTPRRAGAGAVIACGASPVPALGISWQRSTQHHRCDRSHRTLSGVHPRQPNVPVTVALY